MPTPRPLQCLAAVLLAAGACAGPDGATPSSDAASRPRVDGDRALALVDTQVAFGPRVPGRDGHARQLAWMLERLGSWAPEVVADTFTHTTLAGQELTLVNVVARFRPELARRVVVLAHWDTRPTSDQAASPEDRATPVPGANDGASGTAVVLELARVLSVAPPPLGVDLLLVDGEDYGPSAEDMFLGAHRYAALLPAEGRPLYGILLDMVGDADPSFPIESYSAGLAGPVVRKVWQTAERLGYGAYFPDRVGRGLYDDHIPLNDAGLPTVNVIDFDYGPGNSFWHTPADTPDKLSAATLAMVGEVVAELLYAGG